MNSEEAKTWLGTEDGQRFLQPLVDRRVNEGIRTFTLNHPVPDVAAHEKKIGDLEAELREERKAHLVFRKCTEAGLPVSLMDGFHFEDEEELTGKVEQLKQLVAEQTVRNTNERLAGGFRPGSGNAVRTPPDLRNMPQEEANWLEFNGQLNKLIRAQRK